MHEGMHVLVCVHSVHEGMCTHTPILYLLVCTHLISHCGFHKLSIINYMYRKFEQVCVYSGNYKVLHINIDELHKCR